MAWHSRTEPNAIRKYRTAFASLRESQAIFKLAELEATRAAQIADASAASLYKLIRYLEGD